MRGLVGGLNQAAAYYAEAPLINCLAEWRLSVFGTRMYLLRMPGRYQTLAARTLIEFVVAKAREWSGGLPAWPGRV